MQPKIFQVLITSLALILTREAARASFAFLTEIFFEVMKTGLNKIIPGKLNPMNNENLKTY